MLQKVNSAPLVSVIIPVYNVADFLDQCMGSVCRQTYTNLEIILVDDGSTDASAEMCRRWAETDSRIKLIRQQNMGLSGARNTGLEIAKGEWIAFVDSDDWIEPDMYEGMMKTALSYNADIVACGHIREKRTKKRILLPTEKPRTVTSDEALRMIVVDKKLQNHVWSKIYRRHLFDTVRFPVRAIYEDIAVSHLLFHQTNRIVLLDKPYYHYRIRVGGLSRVSRINYSKELHYFTQATSQIDYVVEKTGWKRANYYLHRRAVRCVGHLLLLPKSEETDKSIDQIVSVMRTHPFYYSERFTPIIFVKRLWILHHLPSYRKAYRFIEHFRGNPRF
ncbi:glycosyltransferase [bacterium]|nr:glycosyltransferase [bacterium]